jgi:hypothetical protein
VPLLLSILKLVFYKSIKLAISLRSFSIKVLQNLFTSFKNILSKTGKFSKRLINRSFMIGDLANSRAEKDPFIPAPRCTVATINIEQIIQYQLKGTVQRDLRGVKSGINR